MSSLRKSATEFDAGISEIDENLSETHGIQVTAAKFRHNFRDPLCNFSA
jgi:hypothetical protein